MPLSPEQIRRLATLRAQVTDGIQDIVKMAAFDATDDQYNRLASAKGLAQNLETALAGLLD